MNAIALPILLLAAAAAVAQSPTFASPVRLRAGEALLGEARHFPSPVYHDLDGDGRADIVVGGLDGRLTVAHRTAAAIATFGKETEVNGADGEPVNLHNW
ncbi:MAG: hypothetical protein JNN13_13225 [Planctomycetes bacterium]|nr:hypothetical protein [Planctomycetota bacterium]